MGLPILQRIAVIVSLTGIRLLVTGLAAASAREAVAHRASNPVVRITLPGRYLPDVY
ncbi:hypothetical protein C7410_118103 [Paraburkholderia silvatlantica]|uniref:Uncharacterized protein n=1 Tax=Paraburkholderia silvatlantica TaxID=321895 RepID=A0A2V4TXX0_9BURK|nr:hypothetical protein C7410_118103 [Paraburkholderia silvatlantica]